MSFEIKYDRDGKVVSPVPEVAQLEQAVETPVEQTLQSLEEPQETTDVQELPTFTEETPAEPVQKVRRNEENIRILREKAQRAEQLERERDEAIRVLREMESRAKQQVVEEDEDFTIAPDDLAEGKHLSKVQKKIKKLEDTVRSYQQQSQLLTIESKLKSQYADFDSVVSPENVSALRDQYPEIAATLASNNDVYSKAVSAYTMIKKLGLYEDDIQRAERTRVQNNMAKPRPVAAVSPQTGQSPLSRANEFAEGLTDGLKSKLHREMMEALKNR